MGSSVWSRPDPHGLVFTTRYGSPIEPRNFSRSFTNRCATAGVRVIRLHDTRHTCGSLLAALDVHPRVAMQILRHSKIDVTMEIYTHVPSELTVPRSRSWPTASERRRRCREGWDLNCCTARKKAGPDVGNRPLTCGLTVWS
ncbi:tyrosine-type recombinase/integrase [Actinopolymorpha rutila]|uniref:tyrosine-type recombinase/integrase n=1 Tax=Actinopolymorpha rutila TaxID=446787 RepID=UPI00192D1E58|nr:tyrosine-type recombinase/integrase [Actinopolymorpha rutila]